MVFSKDFLDTNNSGFKVTFEYSACFVYFKIYVDRCETGQQINRVEFNFSVFYDKDKNSKVIDEKPVEDVYKKYAMKCLESVYSSDIYARKIEPRERYYVCIENSEESVQDDGSLRAVFYEDTQEGLGDIIRVDIPTEVLDKGMDSLVYGKSGSEYIILALWENTYSVQLRDMTNYFYSRYSKTVGDIFYHLRDSNIPHFTYELGMKDILI